MSVYGNTNQLLSGLLIDKTERVDIDSPGSSARVKATVDRELPPTASGRMWGLTAQAARSLTVTVDLEHLFNRYVEHISHPDCLRRRVLAIFDGVHRLPADVNGFGEV